jgi:hypothetical protein
MPVPRLTVYVTEFANNAEGVNVALVELVVSVPVTPPETVILVVLSVEVFIASLNTTVIALLMATFVALVLGVRLDTVGAALSST